MSKYVKNLISDYVRTQLNGVDDALLVNMVGLNANTNCRLRAELRKKDIHILVVKNSLARRATTGTRLAPMFEGVSGTSAVCWGGEDIVSLAKEIVRLAKDEKLKPFEARGGVMDGQKLTSEEVVRVSKLPSRMEQLGILVGQILGPGARLASQLNGPGGTLVSQLTERAKVLEEQAAAEAAAAPPAAEAPAAEAAPAQPAAEAAPAQPAAEAAPAPPAAEAAPAPPVADAATHLTTGEGRGEGNSP
jgi:ribosomal protein L10